jgi:hypothetical protein
MNRPTWALCALFTALVLFAVPSPAGASGVWYFHDARPCGVWGFADSTGFKHVEGMGPTTGSACASVYLDPDTTYAAVSGYCLTEYQGYTFEASIYMHNVGTKVAHPVTAKLEVTQGGLPNWVFVGSATVWVTHDGNAPPINGPIAGDFAFGVMTLSTFNEFLRVTIDYSQNPEQYATTLIYWNGTAQCNSALYAWPTAIPTDMVWCDSTAIGGGPPPHPPYWYNVVPVGPRRDFHVLVYDSDPTKYWSWVEPNGWTHNLHQVGCETWVSWTAADPADSLRTRQLAHFGFSNQDTAFWGLWTTTTAGSTNPHDSRADSTMAHRTEPNGSGQFVHVPTARRNVNLQSSQQFPGRVRADGAIAPVPGGGVALVVCGESGGVRSTDVYNSANGQFSLSQSLEGVSSEGSGCLAWSDFDGDGYPDLAVTGTADRGSVLEVYRNDDGTLQLFWQASVGLSSASVAWADYDGDGTPELLAMGQDGTTPRTIIYRYQAGTHTFVSDAELTGLYAGSADWGDYDGDGDPDLLLTGNDGTQPRTILYRNDPRGVLTDTGDHGIPGVTLSDAEWGDFDGDGHLDLAVTGQTGASVGAGRVYRNDGGGGFTQVADLLPVFQSSCAWGDYDRDGRLDIAFCGYDGSGPYSVVFRNIGTGFEYTSIDLPGVREGALCWGDVDGDCDPDLVLVGAGDSQNYTRIYKNILPDLVGVPDTGPQPQTARPELRVTSRPNPFNPRTTIRFDLPATGSVRLAVYDVAGRLVRVLVEGERPAGSHEAVWDGRDSTGRSAPSGSYLARLVAGGKVEGVRLSLVR